MGDGSAPAALALANGVSAPEQRAALQNTWSGCAYCGATGKPLHRDCVLALSRGGRYTLENIVPACASCNNQQVQR